MWPALRETGDGRDVCREEGRVYLERRNWFLCWRFRDGNNNKFHGHAIEKTLVSRYRFPRDSYAVMPCFDSNKDTIRSVSCLFFPSDLARTSRLAGKKKHRGHFLGPYTKPSFTRTQTNSAATVQRVGGEFVFAKEKTCRVGEMSFPSTLHSLLLVISLLTRFQSCLSSRKAFQAYIYIIEKKYFELGQLRRPQRASSSCQVNKP